MNDDGHCDSREQTQTFISLFRIDFKRSGPFPHPPAWHASPSATGYAPTTPWYVTRRVHCSSR